MGYKQMAHNLRFADLALASSMKHNRIAKMMEEQNNSIKWHRVEDVLSAHYTVGTSGESADAYSPVLRYISACCFKSCSELTRIDTAFSECLNTKALPVFFRKSTSSI